METCGLCGTTINEGAIVCAGCGAVKQKFMSGGERIFWLVCVAGLFVMAGMGHSAVAFVLPVAAFTGFLYRYATRQEYWVRNR